jgi:hypothetical protein
MSEQNNMNNTQPIITETVETKQINEQQIQMNTLLTNVNENETENESIEQKEMKTMEQQV